MALIMPNGRPQPPQPQAGGMQTASSSQTIDQGGQAKRTRSVQDAMGELRGYAKTKYGKDLSDQDFQSYAQRTGFTGNMVNDDQYNAAQQEIDKHFKGQAPPAPTNAPPVPGPAPSGHPTPLPPTVQYQPQFAPQITGHLQQMLANPGTMNQQWQDQMFEQQKEQANAYRKQFGEQAAQASAARGLSSRGGVQQAIMGNLDSNLAAQLMAGRRDIGMQAAQTNRQDTFNAINAAQGFDQQGFGNTMAQNQFDLGRWQAQQGVRQGDQSFGLQDWLARQNVDLENRRFGEGQRQFNSGFGLDFLRFLENQRQFGQTFGEGQRQFDNTMGLNWFNAQGNQTNNLMNWFNQYGF